MRITTELGKQLTGHFCILTYVLFTEVKLQYKDINTIHFSQYWKYVSIRKFNAKVVLSIFWTLVTMSNHSDFVGGSDWSHFRVKAYLLVANSIFNKYLSLTVKWAGKLPKYIVEKE